MSISSQLFTIINDKGLHARASARFVEVVEKFESEVTVEKDGLEASEITAWVVALGWETLLNRRGTTWRGLSDTDKENVDEAKAISLMVAHPALIRRPIFQINGTYLVGFKDDQKAFLIAGQ